MKKYILISLLLIGFNAVAQHNQEIVMWEVQTRIGGLLYGISDTKDGADAVMLKFQRTHKDTDNDISDYAVTYQFKTVDLDGPNEDAVADFIANSGNKRYQLLSANDKKTVDIVKQNDLEKKLDPNGHDLEFVYEEADSKPIADNTNEVELVEDNEPVLATEPVKEKKKKNKSKKRKAKNKKVANTESSLANETKEQEDHSDENILWEVETRGGFILSGKSNSKDEADTVMNDFQEKNKGTEYDISDHAAKYTVINTTAASNTPENQNSYNNDNSYVLTSPNDIDFSTESSPVINSNNLIVAWEVKTRAGGLLFGISETKDGADEIMLSFQKRNKDSKYDISDHAAKYQFSNNADIYSKNSPVTKFKSLTKGKLYKVFSAEDLTSIEIIKNDGLNAGIDYYIDARGANRIFTENRLKEISTTYELFRIKKADSKKYIALTDND